MTEEEYFRKNYPDVCYGDRLLSPYWDFFQDGVEFGERQSEMKIEELKMTDEYIIKTLESKVEKLQEDLRNKRISIKNKKAEIKELELELTVEKDQHQEEINLHLHAEDYIEELEKEITELKEKLEHRNCVICSNHDSNIKLLKAKEIIKKLLNYILTPEGFENGEVIKQAEQFLRETTMNIHPPKEAEFIK